MPYHTRTRTTSRRQAELKAMLEARRRELNVAVHGRIRDVRMRDDEAREPLGDGDGPAFVPQQDLELALIQMKAEALNGVNAALRRLDEGRYGVCTACGNEIARQRLSALPFATRCTACERTREAKVKLNPSPIRNQLLGVRGDARE